MSRFQAAEKEKSIQMNIEGSATKHSSNGKRDNFAICIVEHDNNGSQMVQRGGKTLANKPIRKDICHVDPSNTLTDYLSRQYEMQSYRKPNVAATKTYDIFNQWRKPIASKGKQMVPALPTDGGFFIVDSVTENDLMSCNQHSQFQCVS